MQFACTCTVLCVGTVRKIDRWRDDQMMMAREQKSRRYSERTSGMHLFDFNETLSGKRIQDDRRASSLDSQLYRGGRGSDSPTFHGKLENVEMHQRKSEHPDAKARAPAPNIVARLMGLDTLPAESIPAKQPKNKAAEVEKQFKKRAVQATAHPRLSDDKLGGAKEEISELYEMKRQLAMKQMVVREKLNEAKRLLTGERWHPAHEKLNQSKEFLKTIDFFHTNRDAFLKYVDDQDSVLGKHIEDLPHRKAPRNPIVRKVIEERKEDAAFRRNGDASKGFVAVPPTRIVVLKPSPNKNPTLSSFSPRDSVEPKDEESVANPREIAKEIARQVRESVVRDLARNVRELSVEHRLNTTMDHSDDPKLKKGVSSEYLEGMNTPSLRSKLKSKPPAEYMDEPIRTQKKPVRARQATSPSPVSKGIVVLVPDQRIGNKSRPSSTKERMRRTPEVFSTKSGNHSNKKNTVNEILASSMKEDIDMDSLPDYRSDRAIVPDYSSDSESIVRSSGFEGEAAETQYSADVCVSPQPETSSSASDCVSSNPTLPSTVTVECEDECEQPGELEPVDLHVTDVVEVSHEEEASKQASTATDAVDMDETSLNSDNSAQPSPVSVLDSSFEDSPPHVDFDTISSELEELRMHLRMLKWENHDEGHPEDLDDTSSDMVVDKVVVEESPRPPVKTEPTTRGDLQRLDVDLEVDMSGLYCPAGKEREQVYVKNILVSAGLVKVRTDRCSFPVEQHSVTHALDPLLFEKLEDYYTDPKQKYEQTSSDYTWSKDIELYTEDENVEVLGTRGKSQVLNRRHLFDMVDEILLHKYVSRDPWLRTVRVMPAGGTVLIGEVWKRICEYFVYPQGEDLQHTVENLVEKYLDKCGDKWMEVSVYEETIGLELECLILNDLYEETIQSFVL